MIENIISQLKQHDILLNSVSSFFLFVFIVIVRLLLLRWINRWTWSSVDDRRKWIVGVRNTAFILFVLGLFVIWAAELRAVALSLAAIAVAIVLATKEIFLCLSGGVLRASSRMFGIGDRIEIQGLRGDVIDENIFVTTLLEVGPGTQSHQYTGRSVVFPNSLLLAHSVINETYTDDYVLHSFVIPLFASDNWQKAEEIILRVSQEECADFLDRAQRHLIHQARTRGLETPATEPRVTIHLPEPGRIELLVRIPTPARRKGRIEQSILRRYLEEFAPKI